MFKLGRILCKHSPKSDDPENKKVKASSSKSKCVVKSEKHQERSTSIPVFEETKTRDESKLQLGKGKKGSGSILCSPRKGSKDSIARKHYSEEVCKSRTCSKQNCTSEVSDKEVAPSKLTEMINYSVKEAMETLIKQCAMDTVRGNDDSRCLGRTRCYPCDYPRKYDKRASCMKRCKGPIPLCPNVKDVCPAKEKKRCKLPENVQTDNRRMTGNVNIYICSEASENQRKEKQKQKSQSCTESSSETTTERTDSSCARTSTSISSAKVVSNVETRCQPLEEGKLDKCFSMGDTPCAVQSDESNGTCCDRKYDDSLEMDDHSEFSSCESCRSMDIDSVMSSTSSTRDGCCCQGTASSYIDVHHDLSCLKPRFTICSDKFESPCAATIYHKCPAYDEAGDSCVQRSVCTRRPRSRCQDSLSRSMDHRCGYYGGVHKCCCKKRPRFRPIKRRSSFDVLHTRGLCRKWSRCSCILEEDEIEDPMQHATCADIFNEETLNGPDCRIHKSVDNCNVQTMTTSKTELKDEDIIETKKKTSSKCLHKKRKDVSKTHIKSVQKINPVTKKSTIKVVSSSEKSSSSPKQVCTEVDKNLKVECPETSAKKCVKEGQKQKSLSEKKSRCTFFGRSIKKAINIVKPSKMCEKDNRTNCRTKPVQSTKSKIEICCPDEKEKIKSPDCLQEIEQRKEEETLDGCKVTGSSSKRPKTKLQTMLAHKKTSKSEEISYIKKTGDTKKVERVKDTKEKSELLKSKDATGDFEEDCTKITIFKGEPENLGCQADSYSYEKKCSKPTISRCCYCCLPVVDCICECHPPACECHPIVVDNCECDKPKTCDEFCQTGSFYRGAKNVEDDERKGRCYVRQRSRSPEVEYVRGKSCTSHRCGRSPDRNIQRRTMPFSRICCYCKALPCRCKKGKITIRRPRAKCYYCKSCPCTCISAREFNKSRSCKCGDSPCRAKEKETKACGKAFNDARK